MGIPILRGRTFNPALRLKLANEIIVDQTFVNKFMPGEEPIGKHIHTNDKDYVIVGVVGATRFEIGEDPKPMKYFSLESGEAPVVTIVIRSNQDVAHFALPVQRIVSDMDHDLAVSDILTMDQLVGKSTLDASFNAILLAALAVLSLILAAVGLFGVLSYIVAQRTSEIGIRIALGAQREQVLRLMLVDGLWPAVIGLVLGLAAAQSPHVSSNPCSIRPSRSTPRYSLRLPQCCSPSQSLPACSRMARLAPRSDAGPENRIENLRTKRRGVLSSAPNRSSRLSTVH